MVFKIEAICSGNNGRSPLVEAVAKRSLMLLDRRDIEVCSSGTLVGSIDYNQDVRPMLRPFVERAIAKNILNKDALERFEKNPKELVEEWVQREAQYRKDYLTNSLGSGDYSHTPKKTIISPDVDLILPVDQENLIRVKKLYANRSPRPKIITLGEFSGLGYSLDQDFPSTRQEYMLLASQIEAATRAAILKIGN